MYPTHFLLQTSNGKKGFVLANKDLDRLNCEDLSGDHWSDPACGGE
jgi:hypothetical protein